MEKPYGSPGADGVVTEERHYSRRAAISLRDVWKLFTLCNKCGDFFSFNEDPLTSEHLQQVMY